MSVNDYSRILIDNSRVSLQIVASLTDNCGGIIYDSNIHSTEAVFLVVGDPSIK